MHYIKIIDSVLYKEAIQLQNYASSPINYILKYLRGDRWLKGVSPFSCHGYSWGHQTSCKSEVRWSPLAHSYRLSSCIQSRLYQTGRCICREKRVFCGMNLIRWVWDITGETHRSYLSCLVRLTIEDTFSSPSIFGLPYSSSFTCCLWHDHTQTHTHKIMLLSLDEYTLCTLTHVYVITMK